MKKFALYICMSLGALFTACEDDYTNEGVFELSQTEFTNLSHEGEDLSIDLTAYDGWVASCSADWVKLSATEGRGQSTLKVQVRANIENDRSCTIDLRTENTTRQIKISQKALPAGQELHYKLPIVIHVIYNDASNPRQNPDTKFLQDVIASVNRSYQSTQGSVDMNLEFVPATIDPQGNPMPEPGIDRVKWVSSTLEMTDVMFGQERKYNHFLWDPNEYVNVLLYTFDSSKDPSTASIMGVSTFPYSPKFAPMPGTETVQYSHLKLENIKFAYCVSINNIYVGDNPYLFPEFPTLDLQQTSIANTLAHELGHYLGLRHVFSESQTGGTCEDTDYCQDTRSYNKEEYEGLLYDMAMQWQNDPSYRTEENFKKAFMRTCCNNSTFESHNIMDYAYCYSDEFTADQRTRVRHVLEYSPLIPGPKKGRTATRTAVEGLIDLPITVMCIPQDH